MPLKLDWSSLFFSLAGRISPMPFNIGAAVLLLVFFFFESLVNGPMLILGWLVYPALLFMGACLLAKRLHDRGRTGWWSLPILLAVVMVWPAPVGFFDFLAVLLLVWAVIDLCVMPGERGDNRYGRTLFRLQAREPV